MRNTLIPLALLLAACGDSGLSPESADRERFAESLLVSADREGIHLENVSTAELRVAVVDSLFFEHGLASWCMGQDECGTPLLPGRRLLVPADEVVGPPPRQQAVLVFWWDLRPDLTPEQKTARFRKVSVRLP